MTASDRPPPSAKSRSAWRTVLRPVALVALSLVVAVVVAETLLQVSGLTPTRGGVFTVSADAFERIPGIFEPGRDIEARDSPELSYRASIDSLGFRGADFDRVPAEGELRILVTGDALTFGSFVADDQTLPARLEAHLAERCSAPVTVINAGLPGSTIRDQIHLIERALELEPDLVVLQFGEDDVRDLVGPSMWLDLARNREAKSGFPLGLVYPVVRNSALWNLGLRVRSAMVSRRIDDALEDADPDAPVGPETPPPDMPEARAAYRSLLGSLRDRLNEAGIPLVVAVYPSHLSVYDRWDWDQLEWVDSMTTDLGIPTVSFEPVLRDDGRGDRQLYLLPWAGVASPAAYEITARHLAERLLDRGVPDGRCA